MSNIPIESVNPAWSDLFDRIPSLLETPAFAGVTAWFKYALLPVMPAKAGISGNFG
jgi:hypothetical protein